MKTFLIAAGLMVAMLGTAPASAAPVAGNAPTMAAPAPQRDMRDRRDDRRWDRRHDRRRDRWHHRGNRWGWGRRCHSERRHHRWVRICR